MKIFLIAFSLVTFSIIIPANAFTQSITGTVGTSGTFSIKNSTANYFTLSQSSGKVNILKTLEIGQSSSAGVLYLGSNRFMHTFGSDNTFLGENSGNFTLSGALNTGVGSLSLSLLTTGSTNSAFGNSSLGKCTAGTENSAFGMGSLSNNSTGSSNTAFGNTSLGQSGTASENSAFGYSSLGGVNSGNNNSAFGYNSLSLNTSGSQNSAFGTFTLNNNSTGSFNTALGFHAGSIITTGTNLTCIGYNSQPTTGSAANQVTLGNSSVTVLRSTVTTIASLSDARDKKNIKDLTLGLGFIMKLIPREYNWDKREWYENNVSDGSKMQKTPTVGFIAQELDEAQTSENSEWLKLVLKDNPEKWEATPGNLLPVIVKAVQELNTETEGIKNVSDELVNRDKEFEERLTIFEQMQNSLKDKIEKIKNKQTEVKLGEK
jgi:hypothetical protein